MFYFCLGTAGFVICAESGRIVAFRPRASIIASNKPKLDMVLLCIPSQFGLVKYGWELSGLVWFYINCFGMDEFGLVWLSSVWYG